MNIVASNKVHTLSLARGCYHTCYYTLVCAAVDATVYGVRRALALFGSTVLHLRHLQCYTLGTLGIY